MNRCVWITFFSLLGTLSSNATAVDEKACLSGVCLGATMAEMPSNIKWEPVPIAPTRERYRGPDYDTLISRYLKADAAVLQQLMPYRDYIGNIAGLNRPVIEALKKVRGSCVRFTLEGIFYSESRHKTRVVVSPRPTADGQIQQFRVVQITREYTDVLTQQQRDQLEQSLQKQMGYRFGAGRAVYLDNGALNDTPDIELGQGRLPALVITESQAAQLAVQNPDLYRALPGCSKQVKVD